jgi:glycerophosphoryl diester phosphodiesterase
MLNRAYGLLTIFSLYLLQVSCNKETSLTDDTYYNSKVLILGHAGMGRAYIMPSNTYESISQAIAIGCDGSEMDIQITKDSVLVAYHDYTLQEQTLCDGRIIDNDWASIKDCKYRYATKPIFLYSVEDIFNQMDGLNLLYFSLDCKLESGRSDQQEYEYMFMRAIKRLCDKYGLEKQIFIEGPAGFLDKAHELGMKNKLFVFSDGVQDPVDLAKDKYSGFLHHMGLPAEEVWRAHQNGLLVMLGDPDNLLENKEAIAKQPDILQTDDPRSLLKLFKRYNYESVTP